MRNLKTTLVYAVKLKAIFKLEFILIFILLTSLSYAESSPPLHESKDIRNKTQTEDYEMLPAIRAAHFPVKVLKHSISNRIYFLEDLNSQEPKSGHILLLKKNNEPAMAFRVLKIYPGEKKIAVKRVKRYGKYRILRDEDEFEAIEKISDVIPPQTSQDKQDLKELENAKDSTQAPTFDPAVDSAADPASAQNPSLPKTQAQINGEEKSHNHNNSSDNSSIEENKKTKDLEPDRPKARAFDPELDTPTTPHSSSSEMSPESLDEGPLDELDGDSHLAVSVEQVEPLDRNKHWLTAGFGYVRNNGPPSSDRSYLFSSGNIRYGYSVGQMIFFDRAHLQDSLVLESGIYLYKSINFVQQGDAYTVLSWIGNLRYNIIFSRSFALFLYGGYLQSYVLSTSQALDSGTQALRSLLAAAGGGFLFEVGPNWYTRVDIGLDSMTLNLLLRF